MTRELTKEVNDLAPSHFGGALPDDFAQIVSFVRRELETQSSPDAVALWLQWLVHEALDRSDQDCISARQLSYDQLRDAVSASAMANSLALLPSREQDARAWSDRAIEHAAPWPSSTARVARRRRSSSMGASWTSRW